MLNLKCHKYLVAIILSFLIPKLTLITQSQINEDSISLELISTYDVNHTYSSSYWFSQDGNLIVINNIGTIQVLDAETLESLYAIEITLRGATSGAEVEQEEITSVGFVDNFDTLIIGTSAGSPIRDFGTLLSWELVEGSQVSILADMVSVENITTSFEGDFLAYTGNFDEVLVENVITGEIISSFIVDGRFGGSPTFSPSEDLLAIIAQGENIQLFDMDLDTSHSLQPNFVPIEVKFNHSGSILMSWDNNNVELWDIKTVQSINNFRFNEDSFVTDIDINTVENWIVVGGSQLIPEVDLMIVNYVTGEEILFTNGHSDTVFDVAFHPYSQIVISGGRDGRILIWNPDNPDVPIYEHLYEEAIINVDFSPDGRYIFVQTNTELKILEIVLDT